MGLQVTQEMGYENQIKNGGVVRLSESLLCLGHDFC